VPANSLGFTRYTNEEIKSFTQLTPFERKQKIGNLYEAIQLFQASEFKGMIDNVRVIEEATSYMWVFHKNGYDAVRTNEGCCASNSNWLSYILENVYDEIGCFGFRHSDGNGHLINYIKHDGWYYFVDMMMQRHDSAKSVGTENGCSEDFYNNEAFGYIYKAKSIMNFIDYCLDVYNANPPILFYKTNSSECSCIGSEYQWEIGSQKGYYNLVQKSNKTLFYSNDVEILFCDNRCEVKFTKTKAVEPNWSSI